MNRKAFCVLALFLWQAQVFAEQPQWSTVGGKTVGQRETAVDSGVGWPGLHVGVAHGFLSFLDVGARFSFNWGFEGVFRTGSYAPGIKIQGLLKANVLDTGFLSLALKFEPGFLAYFYTGTSPLGVAIPIGAQLGIAVMKRLVVGAHLDLPMCLTFSGGTVFHIPILAGGGAEFFIFPNFLAHAVLKMGPMISAGSGGSDVAFAMEIKGGVSYRF
jgi:hypothetical protein